MKSVLLSALLAGLLLGPGHALAADDAASAPATSAAASAPAVHSRFDPNQQICKRQDQTGSRLGGGRTCHTRQEWADLSSASRTATDDMLERANRNVPHH